MSAAKVGGEYAGTELDLFATAVHWKAYLRDEIAPAIGARVLEVGAGIGGTTRALCDGRSERWTCLEPDAALAGRIEAAIARGELPACCRVQVGTIATLGSGDVFDTIVYVDVLEHIEDDGAEVARAAEHLARGGRLVVMSPAHSWLFSAFDEAIGHYRRYSRAALRAVVGDRLRVERLVYLDAAGLVASLGNRLLLRQSAPTQGQIDTWDRLLVPLSRALDPALRFAIGKSVLGIWRRS